MSTTGNSEFNFPLDVPFMIRLLNEATGTNLRVSRQETFRPVMTIYHGFDRTTEEAANYLIKEIRENETEFFEEITWKSILALLQTKHEFRIKSIAVNFAIGWLIENSEDSTILNTILMSISLPSLNWNRVVAVRVGIHIYLTRPELRDFFIIRLSSNGYIYLKNRPEVLWKDLPYTVCDICRGINAITDDYCNPTWPKGGERYDPEASRWKKGKLVQPSPVKSHTELKNPYYKWNFDPNDFPSETPKPIEPRTPQIFGAFSQQESIIVKPEKIKKNDAVARWLENSPSPPVTPNIEQSDPLPQPVQKMLVKPAGYQKQKEKRESSVVTSSVSSGYQSLKSSEKATKRGHRKNSQKAPVANTTNKSDALKLVDNKQGEKQLEGKPLKNERLHQDKAHKQQKNRNEKNRQSTSNNNNHRRIPVNHRRLPVSVPQAQETMKKEQQMNYRSPQGKPKSPLFDLIRQPCIVEEPVVQKRGTMEYAEYVQMLKDNQKTYPQPPRRDHGTSKETTPEKNEPKFYFDIKTNILEMNHK